MVGMLPGEDLADFFRRSERDRQAASLGLGPGSSYPGTMAHESYLTRQRQERDAAEEAARRASQSGGFASSSSARAATAPTPVRQTAQSQRAEAAEWPKSWDEPRQKTKATFAPTLGPGWGVLIAILSVLGAFALMIGAAVIYNVILTANMRAKYHDPYWPNPPPADSPAANPADPRLAEYWAHHHRGYQVPPASTDPNEPEPR